MSDDIENLRCWRNDPDNTKYLRPIGTITPEMQRAWYEKDLNDNDSYTFGIVETKELHCLVGSIALYNFKGTTCEQGRSLLGDKRARGVALPAFVLIHHIAYSLFGIEKIVAEVNKQNISSIMLCRKLGFVVCGEHRGYNAEHWEFEQDSDMFYNLYSEVKSIQIHTDWQCECRREFIGE
jgi:RimJ/RimL family protein N-acetyltransferase